MDNSIIIQKTVFDIEINDRKSHKYVSNKFSELINSRFKNLLEKKINNNLEKDVIFDSLEIDLGILHINQLNLLENIFITELDRQLDYFIKNKAFQSNMLRSPHDLIFFYINNGYLPWWSKDKKQANLFLQEHIPLINQDYHFLRLITYDLDSFKKAYALFSLSTFSKYIEKILDVNYEFYSRLLSFKSDLICKVVDLGFQTKSLIELQYEILLHFSDKKIDKNKVFTNVFSPEEKMTIDKKSVVKVFGNDIDFSKSLNFETILAQKPSDLNFFLNDFDFNKYDDIDDINSILKNWESLSNFFKLKSSNYKLLFDFVTQTFSYDMNLKIIKIFNKVHKKISNLETLLNHLHKKMSFTNLEDNLLKLYLRFSIISFLIKNKHFEEFNTISFLVHFFSNLSSFSKLNKKNIIKYLNQSDFPIDERDIGEAFEIFIFTNHYASISKRSKENLFYKDLYFYYLKTSTSPHWFNRINITENDIIVYFKILIKKNDRNFLSILFDDKDILNKKLPILAKKHSNLLVEIASIIGGENDLYALESVGYDKTILVKYFNEKLWQLKSPYIKDILNFNLSKSHKLVSSVLLTNDNYNQLISKKHTSRFEKILISFIDIIQTQANFKEIRKINNLLYQILSQNNQIKRTDIWLFIIQLYEINSNLFSSILHSAKFLKFINDFTKNGESSDLMNFMADKKSAIFLNFNVLNVIQIISAYFLDLKNNTSFKSSAVNLIMLELNQVKKHVQFEQIYSDLELFKYYIEIGSKTYRHSYLNQVEYRKIFYELKERKYYLIKKYLHQWSRDSIKIGRLFDLFNSDADFVFLINYIHPNLYNHYQVLTKYLIYLKIDLISIDGHFKNMKQKAHTLYYCWAYEDYIVDEPETILKVLYDSLFDYDLITKLSSNLELIESNELIHEKKLLKNIINNLAFKFNYNLTHQDKEKQSSDFKGGFNDGEDISIKDSVQHDNYTEKQSYKDNTKLSKEIDKKDLKFKKGLHRDGEEFKYEDSNDQSPNLEDSLIKDGYDQSPNLEDSSLKDGYDQSPTLEDSSLKDLDSNDTKLEKRLDIPGEASKFETSLSKESEEKVSNNELIDLKDTNIFSTDIDQSINKTIETSLDNPAKSDFKNIINNVSKNTLNRPEKQQSNFNQSNQIDEKVFIQNAGLILFWPYYKTLFLKVGLIDNNVYASNDSMSKALLLTHYIQTGESESKFISKNLLLNKILCGINLNFEIDSNIVLNDFEIEICNTAINNLVYRWKKIKSIASLREWFLVRDGLLIENENSYILNVQKKPHDILLKHLPWGISVISSKLMKKRIQINWNF